MKKYPYLVCQVSIFLLLWIGSYNMIIGQYSLELDARATVDLDSRDSASVKIGETLSLLQNAYIEEVDYDKVAEKAIKGILENLDPHSVYVSRDEHKRLSDALRGSFEGVGIQLELFRDTVVVVEVMKDGPATLAGIQPGDRIVSIENKQANKKNFSSKCLLNQLKGTKGTKVTLAVKRRGIPDLLSFTIIRDVVPLYSLDACYMASPKVGYIRINKFAANTVEEFCKALTGLKDKGMENLILDLRDNGGGYLRTAIQLADEFLNNNKLVVYTEGLRYPRREYKATTNGVFEQGKLVVLINENSASASEIVAGAIQDWDRGLIIGRRSFGKGLVQKPFKLLDGSFMRLTIAHYYTPSGRSIQRPYKNSTKDSYYQEIDKRYEMGEMTGNTAIMWDDSLAFFTKLKKRTVHGGGGIMPDIFVPVDTSSHNFYYYQLEKEQMFSQFALEYISNSSHLIKTKYPTLIDFKQHFTISEQCLNQLYQYIGINKIRQNKVAFDEAALAMQTEIKALIAKYIWGLSGYYQIANEASTDYQRAMQCFEDKTFSQITLSRKN